MLCKAWRSDKELLRFLRPGPAGVLGFSPIVPSPLGLCMKVLESCDAGRSNGNDPSTAGLSCDNGRCCCVLVSMSVDLVRCIVALEMLDGCSVGGLFLLRVRHTDPTLDSCSDLLFSRDRPPNPNFLRSEDVFEVRDPVLTDLERS